MHAMAIIIIAYAVCLRSQHIVFEEVDFDEIKIAYWLAGPLFVKMNHVFGSHRPKRRPSGEICPEGIGGIEFEYGFEITAAAECGADKSGRCIGGSGGSDFPIRAGRVAAERNRAIVVDHNRANRGVRPKEIPRIPGKSGVAGIGQIDIGVRKKRRKRVLLESRGNREWRCSRPPGAHPPDQPARRQAVRCQWRTFGVGLHHQPRSQVPLLRLAATDQVRVHHVATIESTKPDHDSSRQREFRR